MMPQTKLRRTLVVMQQHLMEICSHICDAFTLIGVVVLQDIILMWATVLCLGCSLLSLAFNGIAYKQGRRKVYPKTIDIAVPLLFVGLLPPAVLYPEQTHRYVFIAINGWLLGAMLFSVLRGRPFTWEYMAEMFPEHQWHHPALNTAKYISAGAWMTSLTIMLGAAVATAVLQLQGFDIVAIMVNYVLQLAPLLLVIAWTVWYVLRIRRVLRAEEAAAASSRKDAHSSPLDHTADSAAELAEGHARGSKDAALHPHVHRSSSGSMDGIGKSQRCRSSSSPDALVGVEGRLAELRAEEARGVVVSSSSSPRGTSRLVHRATDHSAGPPAV